MQFQNLSPALCRFSALFALALTACGGGGGGTPEFVAPRYDLVFDSTGADGIGRLYRVDGSTGQVTAVAGATPGYRPAADPQGRRLVFSARASEDPQARYTLRLLDLGSGVQTRLSADDLANEVEASFAADGERLIYTSDRDGDGDIVLARLAGTQFNVLRNLTPPIAPPPDEDRTPAWSPDGSKIVFTAYRGGNPAIWIMQVNGDNPWQITASGNWGDYSPSWSPDGSRVAFQRVDTVDGVVRSRIGWVATTGGNVTFLDFPGSVYDPRYSPDGKYLAFWAKTNDGGDLYIATPDGQVVKRLGTNGADRHPAWIRVNP
ncbi:TolB family protein [Zoogloea dura]|uniref:TolB protein n=1 Tax=Zoogloea dura TaxID=2728840 RepID=A0A848G6U5_9RHOO|nr:PD40 domain-containing protein [Zoogloea dura]NML26123.1 hypothetical protein [Zoogloea dura]